MEIFCKTEGLNLQPQAHELPLPPNDNRRPKTSILKRDCREKQLPWLRIPKVYLRKYQ